MTPVEFLAEKCKYIIHMRNIGEISADEADEWRAQFLEEALKKEKNLFEFFYFGGIDKGMDSKGIYTGLHVYREFKKLYKKLIK